MQANRLNDWMQVVGIFAVVASLIFVGLQMQQTQEIARATLYQMRSDSSRELSSLLVESQPARLVLIKARDDGYQGLTEEEQILVNATVDSVLGHFENSHHLYQTGFLSQEQWDSDRNNIKSIMGPAMVVVWKRNRSNYRESFAKEIDVLVDGSD